MLSIRNFIVALFLLYFKQTADCVELTFELPDNAKECFYEEIRKNQSAVLEFQVSRMELLCLVIPHNANVYFHVGHYGRPVRRRCDSARPA